MPGRLYLTHELQDILAHFGAESDLSDLPSNLDIAPGDEIAVLTDQRQLSLMRWGLIPVGRKNARGRPVMETIINARSETVLDKSAFEGVGHTIVPATGWYEWTGEKRKKTRWRIRPVSGAPLALAAISDVWQGPGGVKVNQVATLTTEPNADVADYHHRMPVLLDHEAIDVWLTGDASELADVLKPAAAGTLLVEEASDVKEMRGH